MEVFSTKKKFLLTLGAGALTIAAISAASFGVHREAVEAKAEDSTVKTFYFKDAGWWAKDNNEGVAGSSIYLWKGATNNKWPGTIGTLVSGSSINSSGGNIWKFTVDTSVWEKMIFVRTKSTGGADYGAKTVDLTISSAPGNLYDISSASEVWGDPGVTGTWSTYAPHTVTFDYGYKAYGGSTNITTSEVVNDGSLLSAPTDAIMAGKTATWYNGETAWDFSTDTVTSDITLTAQWSDAAASSYKTVYYVLDSDDSIPTYVYSFGGDSVFGAWPGARIPASDITVVLHYNGGNTSGNEGKIVKVTCPSTSTDTKIIFNDGSWQTKDLVLHDGYAYYGDADTAGSADRGLAVSLAYDIEEARNAVTASGTVKDYSICGISQSAASAFVTRYNALGDTYKAEFDATTTYTYNPDDLANETNVTFANIMVTLTDIANQSGSNGRALFAEVFSKDGNAIGFSMIALLLATTLAVTAGIVVKKKKQK